MVIVFDREILLEVKENINFEIERERLRSNFLRVVLYDFRILLVGIFGVVSIIIKNKGIIG